jgi:hypothetical protein
MNALICSILASALIVPVSAATPAEARIQRIEDHLAIERLLMEYGRALDNRDFDAYSQLFAKNGSWSGSLGTFTGPAAIKAAMLKAFAGSGMTNIGSNFHVLTNPIIDIDGDTATASSKWTFMRMVDNKPVIALSGGYADKLVRENGTWKFLSRVASTPPSAPSAPAK